MNAPLDTLDALRAARRMTYSEYMRRPSERAQCPVCGLVFDARDLPDDSDICCPDGHREVTR